MDADDGTEITLDYETISLDNCGNIDKYIAHGPTTTYLDGTLQLLYPYAKLVKTIGIYAFRGENIGR